MPQANDNAPAKKSFNYCFWSKLLVAIPACSLVGCLAASFFDDAILKLAAFGISIGLLVWAAVNVDRMPRFAGKVIKRKAF